MPTKNPKRKRNVNGPSLRSQWLGKQLKDKRIDAQVTLEDAAEHIQRDPTTLGRMEKAITTIRKGDLILLLDLYRVSDSRTRDGLIQLSEDAWRKGWWDGYGKYADDASFVDYPWLESRAEQICAYEAFVIPGLLQTQPYAEALIKRSFRGDQEQTARWLEFRMQRQEVLRSESPPELVFVVWEAALRTAIGGPSVMSEQLGHLRDSAKSGNVELRVLPLSAREHAGLDGPFTIFGMPDPYPDVGYIDNLAGSTFVEETPDVERFWDAYNDLREAALSEAKSLQLIKTISKEL